MGAPETLDAMQQTQFRTFFNALPTVIPCSSCSDHLRKNLKDVPIDQHLASNKDLFRWSVSLHNTVNQQLGKPTMAFADAEKKWKQVCDQKTSDEVSNKTKEYPHSLARTLIILAIGALTGYMLSNMSSKQSHGKSKRV
jgi:hypothetical protein